MIKAFAGLGGGSTAVAAGAVVVVAAGVGAWYQFGRAPVTDSPAPVALVAPADAPEVAPAAPAPQVAPAAPVETAEAPKPEPEAAPLPMPPAFDEVRREADGLTVIAGRAAPGAALELLLDGAEIASLTVDGAGKFAALAMVPPDGKAHVLSLAQVIDGQRQLSEEEIILAPLDPPVVVAEAAPEPAPAPAPTEESAPQAPETETAATPPKTPAAQPEVAAAPAPTEGTETPAPAAVESPVVTAEAETAQAETAEATSAPEEKTQAAAAPVEGAAPQTAEAAPAAAPVAASVAVLKSTAEGVELLNTAPPEVMDNVAIDTISYSDNGDVHLAGRARPQSAAVRVYLDNQSVASLPIDTAGRWRGDLPNVDEGIYTLRVDEMAADGSVASRVETPFKRESPAVLAAASAEQTGPIKAITVQKGATLWAIARDRYGDGTLYVRVFEANKGAIRDPDLIYPGQIFDLPD